MLQSKQEPCSSSALLSSDASDRVFKLLSGVSHALSKLEKHKADRYSPTTDVLMHRTKLELVTVLIIGSYESCDSRLSTVNSTLWT